MQEQRSARVLDLFAASGSNLSPEAATRVFAAYESHYRASWTAYPDAIRTLKALNGRMLAALSNGDQAQQSQNCNPAGWLRTFLTSLLRAK